MNNFLDAIRAEQKKYGAGSGDNFKFEEKGVYKIRIMSPMKVIATHFFGKGNPSVVCVGIDEGCQYHKEGEKKPSIKLACYVVDRNDGKVKMAELPLSISYGLRDLQEDADFAFEGFPMPYDVKITYDPDNNDPKAIYRLVASPKQEPLTSDEQNALDAAMNKLTPEQYVEKRKKGKTQPNTTKGYDYPEGPNPEDVPF